MIASGPAPEAKPNFFKTKNGKILLVVLGAIVVFGAGIGTALVLMNSNKSGETVANKTSEDDAPEETKEGTKTTTKDGIKTTTKSGSSEEVASTAETTIKPIDPSKPINGRQGVTYTDISEGNDPNWNGGWTVAVNSDGNGATLTGDGKKLALYIDDWSGPGGTWPVTGFSGKIQSAIIGEFGQTVTAPFPAFYLMEDGTVEYNPILKEVSGPRDNKLVLHDKFESQGKVSGVNGVVKLYTALADTGYTGGGRTTLAAKADGSFYDLGPLLGL